MNTVRFTLRIVLVALAATCLAQVGTTWRASVSSSGEQGNGLSGYPSSSGDGRFVAFESDASNLVSNDTNRVRDVFVFDRTTRQTTRLSISSSGEQGISNSYNSAINGDGRFVAFTSAAPNLVSGDTNNAEDVFVHDRQTGQTTRVSVSSSGQQGSRNGGSFRPSISSDGRFVAFASAASNLVSGDRNNSIDIFVHDRQTGQTTRVSVTSAGQEEIGNSGLPSISADGRFVAFQSLAGLVSGDRNERNDIYVHDRQTAQTTCVSVSQAGESGNGESLSPDISADGRFVAFWSKASNLVSGDTNGYWDVFVHDRQSGQTTLASVSSSGEQGNNVSWYPSISANGRFMAFFASATNLVPDDTNGRSDVFVHDRQTGRTVRVSVSSSGQQGNWASEYPCISADGRLVTFESFASNLVPDDTNGQWDVFVHHYRPGMTARDP